MMTSHTYVLKHITYKHSLSEERFHHISKGDPPFLVKVDVLIVHLQFQSRGEFLRFEFVDTVKMKNKFPPKPKYICTTKELLCAHLLRLFLAQS